MIEDYNNLYSIVKCLPLEHVCPRLSGDFLVIVDLSLELITIPCRNQKEEIGSYRCLGNVVHHRIAYRGSFFPWIHEILWHPDMTLAWFTHQQPLSHFFSEIQILFSGVSAEYAVICIVYFEAVLLTTLSSQGFQGEKGLIIRKDLFYHCVGDNFCL